MLERLRAKVYSKLAFVSTHESVGPIPEEDLSWSAERMQVDDEATLRTWLEPRPVVP